MKEKIHVDLLRHDLPELDYDEALVVTCRNYRAMMGENETILVISLNGIKIARLPGGTLDFLKGTHSAES